jgi:hypothetical protein
MWDVKDTELDKGLFRAGDAGYLERKIVSKIFL